MKQAKLNFFEHTNKTGRWLAYKLHKIPADKRIPRLLTPEGKYSSDTEAVKETVFKNRHQLFSGSPKSSATILINLK